MREKRREPEVPEGEAPAVERLDGLARITLEELAITNFVKNVCTPTHNTGLICLNRHVYMHLRNENGPFHKATLRHLSLQMGSPMVNSARSSFFT